MTPSNANTSGLLAWAYRLKEHDEWSVTTSPSTVSAVADRPSLYDVAPLVTAASAQAKISELETLLEQAGRYQADFRDSATAAEARIATILEGECKCCVLTRAACADAVAEIEIGRKTAEARADRLAKALEDIVAIEPRPFEGGLDMEAIRSCDECKRYEGHPVQHGICNTHRRPIWDREKHDGHEKVALGYRAKSIARAALQQEG